MLAGMESVRRAAAWAGWDLSADQEDRLERFARWLEEEAIPAGAVGPGEVERLLPRHVADSLLFAAGWEGTEPPDSVIDLGSGAGLPGIPLAVLWPRAEVALLDRAGRRVRLARRAVRVLGLPNVTVEQADAAIWTGGPYSMVVARATAEPEQVALWGRRLAAADGVVVIGGSWRAPPPDSWGEVLVVPPEVLDRPIWLRKMAPA